jgi:hypothetical protein
MRGRLECPDHELVKLKILEFFANCSEEQKFDAVIVSVEPRPRDRNFPNSE